MKHFISFAVLIAVFAMTMADDQHSAEMQKNIDDCNKQNGVKAQEFQDLITGKLRGDGVRDNLKCSLHCVMKKEGFMDEAGHFDANAMKAKIDDKDNKKMMEAFEKCKDASGPTACDTAYMITECMIDNNIKLD